MINSRFNSKYNYLFVLIIILLGVDLNAQYSPFSSSIELLSGYNGPNDVPFLIRSNQYGSVPSNGVFASLKGSLEREYNLADKKKIDWGFSVEGRANLGNSSNLALIEGYFKVKLSLFEIKAGRSKDMTGLCDTSLTSGSYSESGNALGIPKIEISIPEFYTIPFLGKMFSFKGNFVHGWVGNTHKNFDSVIVSPTYLHQKSLYGRFGKSEWKLKLYGGFNHEVIWGDESLFMGEDFTLSAFQNYIYVVSGKRFNNNSIQMTRVGNHLGTIDIGLAYDFRRFRLFIYRQNIYEAGALYHFANIIDGLNGISITNTNRSENHVRLNKMLVEVLHTKNQAGEIWSRKTPSSIEDYFNNGYYLDGWSYHGSTIGTPFISPRGTIRNELPIAPNDYFVNNRVIALHFGVDVNIAGLNLMSKISFSKNYGTYGTAAEGNTDDPAYTFPSPYGVFPVAEQFSGLMQVSKGLKNGYALGFLTAADMGELFDNTFGLIFYISKEF